MPAAASRPARLAPAAAGWAAAVTGVAIGGALADPSSNWYHDLDKPSWQPPDVVFGPVWTVLYVLIATSATLAVRDVPEPRRRIVIGLFSANLALNLAWSWIFFRGHAPRAAGIEILVLLGTIVALIRLIWPHNRAAALALAPYGAWVAFATALNWSIAARN
jgi:translocator protein